MESFLPDKLDERKTEQNPKTSDPERQNQVDTQSFKCVNAASLFHSLKLRERERMKSARPHGYDDFAKYEVIVSQVKKTTVREVNRSGPLIYAVIEVTDG